MSLSHRYGIKARTVIMEQTELLEFFRNQMMPISLSGGVITIHIALLQTGFNAIIGGTFFRTQNYAYSSLENINDLS